MSNYFKRLKNHAGVPVATLMSFMLTLAGASNENMSILAGSILGFSVSLIFWAIVLITARTQPLNDPSRGEVTKEHGQ